MTSRLTEIMRLAEEKLLKLWPVDFDPQTILQMVELIRMQHEALELSRPSVWRDDTEIREKALAAFEKFDKGE